MKTVKIQIEFADSRIKAIDYIQDLRKAAANAGLNLYSKYGVRLQSPMPMNEKVVVDVWIPDEIAETFEAAIGNHLRGISKYMLSAYGERYQGYLVGKRLLQYNVLKNEEENSKGLIMIEKLDAIIAFTKLLERSDDYASEITCQIVELLKEAGAYS